MGGQTLSPVAGASRRGVSAETHAETTKRLLASATIVFGKHGYEAARVTEIARRCGLTTGAVYSRWLSKRELFLAVVEDMTPRHMASLLRSQPMSAGEKTAILGADLLSTASDELRDFMLEACVAARRDVSLTAEVAEPFEAEAHVLSVVAEYGQETGTIDQRVDREAIVFFCQALGLGARLLNCLETDNLQRPSDEDWNYLMGRIINSMTPTDAEGMAAATTSSAP